MTVDRKPGQIEARVIIARPHIGQPAGKWHELSQVQFQPIFPQQGREQLTLLHQFADLTSQVSVRTVTQSQEQTALLQRKSVVYAQRTSVRLELGRRPIIKKKSKSI